MDCDPIPSNFIEIVQNILERGAISKSFSNFREISFKKSPYCKLEYIAWPFLELLSKNFGLIRSRWSNPDRQIERNPNSSYFPIFAIS
jgi:hypothetical protein